MFFYPAVWVLAVVSVVGAAQNRPNILLIISDDQGYSDFGFMGNPILRTPTLDKLAESGAVFRNYSTGPACSPGRSMLFTGRNYLLTGVWGVPLRQNLRTDETMMPAFFEAAGPAGAGREAFRRDPPGRCTGTAGPSSRPPRRP